MLKQDDDYLLTQAEAALSELDSGHSSRSSNTHLSWDDGLLEDVVGGGGGGWDMEAEPMVWAPQPRYQAPASQLAAATATAAESYELVCRQVGSLTTPLSHIPDTRAAQPPPAGPDDAGVQVVGATGLTVDSNAMTEEEGMMGRSSCSSSARWSGWELSWESEVVGEDPPGVEVRMDSTDSEAAAADDLPVPNVLQPADNHSDKTEDTETESVEYRPRCKASKSQQVQQLQGTLSRHQEVNIEHLRSVSEYMKVTESN